MKYIFFALSVGYTWILVVGVGAYDDPFILKANSISLCSHPRPHPNSTREVRHSLTWHSGESESALKRFEPVAVTML